MIQIRTTQPEDAEALLRLARAEPLFSPADVQIVEELLNDFLSREDHNGYFFLEAWSDGQMAGFACYGPTPLTQGTFDLYWICVAEQEKGKGIGRQLIRRCEEEIRRLGGRLIVLDTSGDPGYAPTRAFYEHLGYSRTAVVPDFYAPGEDLVIFTRRLE